MESKREKWVRARRKEHKNIHNKTNNIKIWNLQTVTKNPKKSKQISKSIPIQPKYPKTKSYFIPRYKKGKKIIDGSFGDLMMVGKWPDHLDFSSSISILVCACGFGVLSLARERMAAEKLTVTVELRYFSLVAIQTLSLFVTVSFSSLSFVFLPNSVLFPFLCIASEPFFFINLCFVQIYVLLNRS